ncbi:hypothetical protein F4801DRAFT_208646 [Xylaria longipes]|nr:hypothetical protein F4801DRAFT_208646 [Xylaria longipes]
MISFEAIPDLAWLRASRLPGLILPLHLGTDRRAIRTGQVDTSSSRLISFNLERSCICFGLPVLSFELQRQSDLIKPLAVIIAFGPQAITVWLVGDGRFPNNYFPSFSIFIIASHITSMETSRIIIQSLRPAVTPYGYRNFLGSPHHSKYGMNPNLG